MSRLSAIAPRSMLAQILAGFGLVIFVFTIGMLASQAFFETRFFTQMEEEKGAQQAVMLAKLSTIGLYTDNTVIIEPQLEALLSRPEVSGVALYLDDGSCWIKKEKEKQSVSELPPEEVKEILTGTKEQYRKASEQGEYVNYCAPVKLISLSDFSQADQQIEVIGLAQVTISTRYLKTLLRRGRLLNLTSIAIAAVLAIIFAFWLARRLSTPVHELTKGAKRVAAGDLDAPVLTTTTGELADLTVTFNKMLESLREREHLMAELQQAQKLEAIGTLAGGIAHDFNNILSGIIGFTELTQLKLQEDTQEHKNLSHVLKACMRARDLVAQILTFSRQSQKKKQPLQASLIIKEALKLLRASLPANIEISQNIQNTDRSINADPVQIHQIVMNLCTNAFHAMESKGGLLSLELIEEKITAEQTMLIPDLAQGEYLRFSVSDTGVGMKQTVAERIFEPFFTTKEKGKGTGMGLSMVHGIIKEFGGAVTVASEPGRGTTFDLYFPLLKGYQSVDTSNIFSSLPKGSGRVLFVDDEEDIINIGKQMLEFFGYDVTCTLSSLEALEIFKSQPDNFDLLITDQTMPKMTGTELTEKILKIRPDLPIILATGYSSTISAETAAQYGICKFIKKPHSLKKLSEAVHSVLP